MLFAIKYCLQVVFLYVVSLYLGFKWANRLGKNPWKWAVVCFLFSYWAGSFCTVTQLESVA